MTSDEREMLRDTHDAVIRMEGKLVMVESHDKILNGNGNRGHVKDVTRFKMFMNLSCWFYGGVGLAGIAMVYKVVYGHFTG